MKVIGFKIYYADESTFSSKQGSWEHAPSEGVQFVIVYFDQLLEPGKNMRLIRFGRDYFWREETPAGVVFGMSYDGDDPTIPKAKPHGVVKKGVTVPDEAFLKIQERLQLDQDWVIA